MDIHEEQPQDPKRMLEEVSNKMHLTLAEELLGRINSGEATSADLNVARQFLKDNDITGIAVEGDPLAILGEILPFKPDEKRN